MKFQTFQVTFLFLVHYVTIWREYYIFGFGVFVLNPYAVAMVILMP